jgi:hypothetical protein
LIGDQVDADPADPSVEIAENAFPVAEPPQHGLVFF